MVILSMIYHLDVSSFASTNDIKVAAYKIINEDTFGIQFHPEVYHTKYGKEIISNFFRYMQF